MLCQVTLDKVYWEKRESKMIASQMPTVHMKYWLCERHWKSPWVLLNVFACILIINKNLSRVLELVWNSNIHNIPAEFKSHSAVLRCSVIIWAGQ